MSGLGMLTTDTVGFGRTVACFVPVGAILAVWLLRIIPQRPFDVLEVPVEVVEETGQIAKQAMEAWRG